MRADDAVGTLFDEFVEAQLAGQRPDVRAYLRRAGDRADELGRLLDRFLEVAPVEEPDAETVAILTARLEQVTPLTAARTRRRLRVDEVVERLGVLLALKPLPRARLRQAYQELEGGQLDPAGVHERVWAALQTILGVDPRRLGSALAPPPTPRPAFRRAADFGAASALRSRAAELRPHDEVDRLFRGVS